MKHLLPINLQFFALAGKNARVLASGTAAAFTAETFSTTDDKTYTIDDATKNVWDRTATITVKEAGVPTVENFTLNRLTGTITFENVNALRGAITADGSFLPMTAVAEAREYTYTIDATNEDSTIFGDQFIARTQTMLDFTGSLMRFASTDTLLTDNIQNGTIFVLEFFDDFTNGSSLLAWVLLSTDEKSAAVDSLVEESVDFEGAHDDDRRVISIQKLGFE